MYENFARVYDTFMDNVPYDAWAGYLIRKLKKEGIADGLVLDLGCGTGQMTRRLADAGYDMIGADGSADMLQIAQEAETLLPDASKISGRKDILYLLQDIRAFELYGTVRITLGIEGAILVAQGLDRPQPLQKNLHVVLVDGE